MQRIPYILFGILCLITSALSAQNYQQDFSSGDRDHYYGECWRFSGTSIRTNGSHVIDEHTVVSGPVSNIDDPHWVSTPVVQLMGSGSITFDHKISNASSRWLDVFLIEGDKANPDTINIFSHTYTNSTLIDQSVDITAAGFYKILFQWSGTGGAGRGSLDNLTVPGPNVAALVGDCSSVNFDLAFPVEWLHFAVEQGPRGIALDWATATEQNSDRFEIERSYDGTSFEKRGAVAAAGYSAVEQQYSFTDAIPTGRENQTIYYRLRQIDLDGRFDYSEVREIRPEASLLSLTLAPNPASTHTNLLINTPERSAYILQIMDAAGRLHLSQRFSPGEAQDTRTVPLQGWPKGLYWVQLSSDQATTTQRLVIR